MATMERLELCFHCFCLRKHHDENGCQVCRCDVNPNTISSSDYYAINCRECKLFSYVILDRDQDVAFNHHRSRKDGEPHLKNFKEGTKLGYCARGYLKGFVKADMLDSMTLNEDGTRGEHFLVRNAVHCADYKDGNIGCLWINDDGYPCGSHRIDRKIKGFGRRFCRTHFGLYTIRAREFRRAERAKR